MNELFVAYQPLGVTKKNRGQKLHGGTEHAILTIHGLKKIQEIQGINF